MRMDIRRQVLLLAMAVLASPVALAETEEELSFSNKLIETVVVVGKSTNIDIDSATLEQYQANDLADVFRLEPSVSVGGSLGIAQKVYIRGLEDTLLNITVDGAPQTGTLFHHIGRVSIEPELLREVEVQAGAGEATSGFGAIGGAIRFKTKAAADLLAPGRRSGALIKAGYFSNDGHKTSMSGYGLLNDDWSVLASAVAVDRDNMKDGDGDVIEATESDQQLGFFKLNGDIASNQRLSFSVEYRNEEADFSARPNWSAEGLPTFPTEANRLTTVFNYSIDMSAAMAAEMTIYRTKSEFLQNRRDSWGRYSGDIESTGFDIRHSFDQAKHSLVYGIEYRADTVVSRYLDDASVAWDPTVDEFKETGDVLGVYLQDHYQVNSALLLSAGLRYDNYQMEQMTYGDETEADGVSANIGASVDLSKHWALNLGIAQALRGKEVGDAFTLEMNPAGDRLADGLEPEEVLNKELGLNYLNGPWQGKIAVYKMRIDNVIMDQLGNGGLPEDSYYYENVGELETEGGEVLIGYATANARVDVSYVVTDATLNGHTVEAYEENGLGNTSGDTWMLNLEYNPNADVTLAWSTRWVESLDDIEVLFRSRELGWTTQTYTVDKPSYSVTDISVSWQPVQLSGLTLGLAVQNLFDEHYRDHASVADYGHIPDWEGVAGVHEAGRDIRVNVAYAF